MWQKVVQRMLFSITMCVLLIGSAMAQEGGPPAGAPPDGAPPDGGAPQGDGQMRRGPQANPEGWAAQARMVGEAIGLKSEEVTKLVEVYKSSRENMMAARMKMRSSEGDREKMRETMRESMKAERAKLETTIKGILSADNAAKATVPLTANVPGWERMALLIEEMKLEAKTKLAASGLILDYVVASDKLMQPAADQKPGDRTAMEKMFSEMTKLKEKLDTDMAKVLSADQLKKWKEGTQRRGPGGPGGPGGGGPGGPGGFGGPGGQGGPGGN